jgi:hypothetical protein
VATGLRRSKRCCAPAPRTRSSSSRAGVSRSREIYILAANYLQQLDWRNDPEVSHQGHHLVLHQGQGVPAALRLLRRLRAVRGGRVEGLRQGADRAQGGSQVPGRGKYLAEAKPKPGAGDGEEDAPASAAGSHDEQLMALQQRIMLVERFFIAQRTLRDAMTRTRPSASPPRCSRTPTRPAPSV